ncbi:MAG TPA: CAP domain-containing protein [Candidatus Saccharimonadales bacterium]|nr:CAP domain-containing protein [Candidatus Saccharimonadales bacterium]
MLLIVFMGLLVNSVWSGKGVLGSTSDFSASSLLSDTNAERAKHGEPPLRLDARLSNAAQAKADDMIKYGYWSHTSPDGKTPWTFITQSGYRYQVAGENLAYGFASATDSVVGWMNSPEHRDNILNKAYRDVGFGVASSPNFMGHGPETIVVAEYGRPAESGAGGAVPVAGASAGTVFKDGGKVLGAELAARPVSRIQLLTGDAKWSLFLVVAVTGAAGTLFMLRHGYKVHRWATRGEMFVTQHPYYDIAIVAVITAGLVLTRVSGIVR